MITGNDSLKGFLFYGYTNIMVNKGQVLNVYSKFSILTYFMPLVSF